MVLQLQIEMEDIIKQQLHYYSNSQFTLPGYRKLNIPRYERNTSFSQLSNWTNSDKFASTRLPRISSHVDSQQTKTKIVGNSSFSLHNYCPVKQMDINLQPLRNDEDSYYCKYLKNKRKAPLRQIEFIASTQRRGSHRGEVLSTGRLKEIIQRKKDGQINVNIEQYLRTTQLFKKIEKKGPK